VVEDYTKYLDKHAGTRPKRFDSFHTALSVKRLLPYRDAWAAELRDRLGLSLE
jgi:hypothetical protein